MARPMDQESLRLDEATARALVLVQTIDEGDPQGSRQDRRTSREGLEASGAEGREEDHASGGASDQADCDGDQECVEKGS